MPTRSTTSPLQALRNRQSAGIANVSNMYKQSQQSANVNPLVKRAGKAKDKQATKAGDNYLKVFDTQHN